VETTWFEIGDITLRAPVTTGTNLLVFVQCLAYALVLRPSASETSRLWAGFFAAMSAAMLAGAFKHGLHHVLQEEALVVVLAISNIAGALSTHFAQRAALASGAWTGRRTYLTLARGQLATFGLANVAFGPQLWLLIVNNAVGLPAVIAGEVSLAGRLPGAAWVAGGLSASILTGAVYLTGVSFGRRVNHIDLAHAVKALGFLSIYRGVRRQGGTSGH